MASPASLAIVGIGSSAAGGIFGAIGAKKTAAAQADMYRYQAGAAQFNKKIAEQNRDYALASGELEAGRYGLKAQQTAGSIKARQAASGISVNTGSAVDVQESAHSIAKTDMGTIRNNAARVAYGYSVEAMQQDLQSGLYMKAASNAKAAGNINAMSSLISGASSVASKWGQASSAGIFGKTASSAYTDPAQYGTIY